MYLRDCFALKPFRDYSLCSVCILPQPAVYSQSVVCILHSVFILPLVRSLQSAVRILRFTLTDSEINIQRSHYYVNSSENTFIHVPSATLYSDHIYKFRK